MAKKFDFLSPGIEIREVDQSFLPSERDAEGPIIIGRTRKGPAMKPIKITSLDNFVSVFGAPVPGGTGDQGDMWREGNLTGPTYASYAAQAWLASEESPVVMVRIAGEEHPQRTNAGRAGWQLDGDLSSTIGSNATAYGVFIFKSGSGGYGAGGLDASLANYGTGSLGAIIYANAGSIELVGTTDVGKGNEDSATADGSGLATFVKNNKVGAKFALRVRGADNAIVEDTINFNFDRNSSEYIRSVLNTNPQLVNPTTIAAEDRKTYWLGETFTREVENLGIASDAALGSCFACLLPLESGSVNWSDHREGAVEAKSGFVISSKETGQQHLFRLVGIGVGDEIQKNYMIAIEDIRNPANPNVEAYGSFSVCVKTLSGQTVERFSNLNLNPASPNYIGRRIGDQRFTWDDQDRRYRILGDFPNQSDFVYVEVVENIKDGGGQGLLPAGFKGVVRPKGFTVVQGSTLARTFSAATGANISASAGIESQFAKGFVSAPSAVDVRAYQSPTKNVFVDISLNGTASFRFPSIPLRQNGTEGGAPDPYRAYYGIRPKLSATSTQHDPDYTDYIRKLPVGVDSHTPGADYEHSYIFSLDDLIVRTETNQVTYSSGSYDAAAAVDQSYTQQSGTFGDLLDLNIRQFMMPIFGGVEGFDITEKEPLRTDNIGTTRNEQGNYVQYSLYKALDSVKDPENVAANLLTVPGIRAPLITNRMIQIAETRKDVLAIIDIENDYVPRAERNSGQTDSANLGAVKTAVSTLKGRNLNSSFACAFYPWVQIVDNINGGNYVWVPPSVAALGAFGNSQRTSELWFAPAGFNRGGLGSLGGPRGPSVLTARQRLDSTERDLLYDVNINPIATFPAEGLVIFGQKTLQASQSALDRINVRRLVLFLKSRVSAVARNLLFDQNLPSTWARFKGQVDPILSDVRTRFGLADYKIVLDTTTTTPDLVDRNVMYAKIFIKPARAIEFIVVDFVITNSGADFV